MYTQALAGLVFCAIGWTLALGMFLRYGGPMKDFLSRFVSFKSLGAALYLATPSLLHAAVPKIPLEACEAATLFIGVHLFHMAPPAKPVSK